MTLFSSTNRMFCSARWTALGCGLVCIFIVTLFAPSAAQAADRAFVAGPSTAQYTTYLPQVGGVRQTPLTNFGIQVYGPLDTPSAGLELAKEANASWLRTQMSWRAIEPVNVAPSAYDFGAYDSSLLIAVQQGIRPIVTIFDNPEWAATYSSGPIDKADIEQFGEFVGAVVERYDGDGFQDAPGSPRIQYWEFYNEPDSGDELRAQYGQAFWGHYGAQYAQMLCVANWYAKTASPDVRIVFGGVAHDWFNDAGGPFVESFIDDVFSAGGAKCLDVMNFHYYPVFAENWESYGPGIVGKAAYMRSKLNQYGIADKPMMCTEAGWHSDANPNLPSSPEKQADFVVRLFTQVQAARLVTNIWWTWIDFPSEVGSFGLLTQELLTKPAYYAFQYASSELGTASFVRALSSEDLGTSQLEGYLFSHGTPLYVLWSNDNVTHDVQLPGEQARLRNSLGEVVTTISDAQDGFVDGRITVAVGPPALYVEFLP